MRIVKGPVGVGILVLFALAYGFMAGWYQWFPFFQVAYLKNVITERVLSRAPVSVAVAMPPGVEMLNTELQRILIKRIPLPVPIEEISGGGAFAVGDSILYLFGKYGRLLAFNLTDPAPLDVAVPAPPINYDEMMRTRLRYEVNIRWFRISGAYVDAESDSRHTLFVAHNVAEPDNCITFNISRITVDLAGGRITASDEWRTIFKSSPCLYPQGTEGPGRHPFSGHISGGKMEGYDDGRLLVTVGDFTYDGGPRGAYSQDITNPYGKYILVDKDSGAYEVLAIGGRNSMGLTRDSEGIYWATESGPQGGDELNIIFPGANYGWPLETYGINYDTTPWQRSGQQGRHETFDGPVYAWLPSIVPTGIVRIPFEATEFGLWAGDLVLGTLRDQSLRRLRLDADNRVVYDERIEIGNRIRDLVVLGDGTILVLTDATAELLFMVDGGPVFEPISQDKLGAMVALGSYDNLVSGFAAGGEEIVDGSLLFESRCSTCHTLTSGGGFGPSLAGLMARQIGSSPGFRYSPALAASDQVWSANLLAQFLADPVAVFPGTFMPKVPLSETQIDSLVTYLLRTSN